MARNTKKFRIDPLARDWREVGKNPFWKQPPTESQIGQWFTVIYYENRTLVRKGEHWPPRGSIDGRFYLAKRSPYSDRATVWVSVPIM